MRVNMKINLFNPYSLSSTYNNMLFILNCFFFFAIGWCKHTNSYLCVVLANLSVVLCCLVLSQGSAMFNFWQEWKQGCERYKYNVFNGLHCCFTTYQLFSWWEIFPRLSVYKKIKSFESCGNYMIWELYACVCHCKYCKSISHKLISFHAKFNIQ